MIELNRTERELATSRLNLLAGLRDLTIRTAVRLPTDDRDPAIANALALDWAWTTIRDLLAPTGDRLEELRNIRGVMIRTATALPVQERDRAMHNAQIVGWAIQFIEAAAEGRKPTRTDRRPLVGP